MKNDDYLVIIDMRKLTINELLDECKKQSDFRNIGTKLKKA